MEIYYENTNITDYIQVRECIHRDAAGGRCDTLEIHMENAAQWHKWQPKKDDAIEVEMSGYTTGKLYVNTIMPDDGIYKIIATSLPSAAYRKEWNTHVNTTLAELMQKCAAECGMEWAIYGLDANTPYKFLLRKNEGCAAFLQRIMEWEGAQLKSINGKLTGIGIEYAQRLAARQNIEITAAQDNVCYRRHDWKKYAGITIETPFATVSAVDDGADNNNIKTITGMPVSDEIQAGRWARGQLLNNNRKAEETAISMEFNPGITALARIDITGDTDAAGEWLISTAEHDFVNERTYATMHKNIYTIR